jgi:hypothetical protein
MPAMPGSVEALCEYVCMVQDGGGLAWSSLRGEDTFGEEEV